LSEGRHASDLPWIMKDLCLTFSNGIEGNDQEQGYTSASGSQIPVTIPISVIKSASCAGGKHRAYDLQSAAALDKAEPPLFMKTPGRDGRGQQAPRRNGHSEIIRN